MDRSTTSETGLARRCSKPRARLRLTFCGRTGEAPLAGFAIRGRELVVYLDCEGGGQKSLLSKLGKHRMSKCCLYFKRLADLDKSVLRELVTNSIAEVRSRYGKHGGA